MPSRKPEQRKSDVSTTRFALKDDVPEDNTPAPASAVSEQDARATSEVQKDKSRERDLEPITIEDLTLPKSIIARLAKGVLPANTQIQANAVLALSKSTTVFINHLATYANEHTVSAGKKTISPADVFKALEDTEFSFLKERLEAEFAKFNSIQTEKRTSYRNKIKATKTGGPSTQADTSMTDTTIADTTMADDSHIDASSAPRSKKARIDPSAARDEEHDDAETEDDELVDDDEEHVEDEIEEEDEKEGSGDDTQDALEERNGDHEVDEALDGDESD